MACSFFPFMNDAEERLQKAVALHQQGRFPEARSLYEAILQAQPQHADALQWLATWHAQQGGWLEALELYNRALKQQPDHAEAHANRGNVLRCLGRQEEALASFDRALELNPAHAATYNNRGIALADLGRNEEAVASYDQALKLQPGYLNAWRNRGVALRAQGQSEAALASYDEALKLAPQDAPAWLYRGHALRDLHRLEGSLASYDRFIALRPRQAEGPYNRSIVLLDLLRLKEALASADEAIQLKPDFADAHWHKAQMLILAGDYPQGWPLFEWRWKSHTYGRIRRPFDRPLWLGESELHGQTLLIDRDGGFGDTLHFCRYAPLLAARGATVILEVQPGLVRLLTASLPGLTVIGNRQGELPPFDLHCPMMSLPLACVSHADDVPNTLPYLTVPPEPLARWQTLLGEKNRPQIGLVWSGSLDHSNDFNRSIPLRVLAELLHEGAEFHCLQKEIRPADMQTLEEQRLPIQTWTEHITDFADTAALARQMDLVISVDTSIAHLAGGLGLPVWLLLPYVPDMRWHLDREDSPWYPGVMRLFRQGSDRQWSGVMARVAAEMKNIPSAIQPNRTGGRGA